MKLPIADGVLATVKILVKRMATFLLVQRMATASPEPPAVTQVLAEAQEPGLHQLSMATAGQGEHLSRTRTQTRPEWKWNIHYPTNRIIPAGFQTPNSPAINTVVHQLWEGAVALPTPTA